MTEQVRRQSNAAKVLALLKARGAAGATNAELLDVGGYRYGGRLHELRRDWCIDSEPVKHGLWRFILRGPRQAGQQELPIHG